MSNVIQEMTHCLGATAILEGDAIGAKHRVDWTGLAPAQPLAVVLPSTTEQVSAVLRTCNSFKQSVVPQGGMTGLAGGATPKSEDICLSLDRMSGIEDIDECASTMTVLAGTTLSTIQEAAAAVNLTFAIDMASRASCQIGGALATNAGGLRVLQSGTAREQVLGMEVVLADGTVLTSLNKMMKNNTGYDLKQLFVGSEGTLGVITRAVLRLRPKPRNHQTALCALESFDGVLSLLKHLRQRLGPELAAFEVMWADFFEFGLSAPLATRSPFNKRYPLYVLTEQTEFKEANIRGQSLESCLSDALESGLIIDAAIPHSESETKALWAIRECTSEFPLRLEPINFDVSLPIAEMGCFVEECRTGFESLHREHRSLIFGHAGDSNLHVTVDARSMPGISHQTIERLLYSLLERRKGSISAEHGIGTMKREYLSYSRTPAELATMYALKNALDPNGIMNPGKLLPAVHSFAGSRA